MSLATGLQKRLRCAFTQLGPYASDCENSVPVPRTIVCLQEFPRQDVIQYV